MLCRCSLADDNNCRGELFVLAPDTVLGRCDGDIHQTSSAAAATRINLGEIQQRKCKFRGSVFCLQTTSAYL